MSSDSASPPRELVQLIKEHCGTRHFKVLLCSGDVAEALGRESSLAAPPKPWETGLAALLAISIVVTPDSAPGTWRLVRHDYCVITDDQRVIHDGCTILGENSAPDVTADSSSTSP